MSHPVYQVLDLVGTSSESIEDAINEAIAYGVSVHGQLDWYEVVETRGIIEGKKSKAFQVHVKIGCHAH